MAINTCTIKNYPGGFLLDFNDIDMIFIIDNFNDLSNANIYSIQDYFNKYYACSMEKFKLDLSNYSYKISNEDEDSMLHGDIIAEQTEKADVLHKDEKADNYWIINEFYQNMRNIYANLL